MSERRTVLLVDDDPGTLHVLQHGLSKVLGLVDVVTASNGREAIETLERRTVDAVVTDLAMPVLDGFSLIAAINNRFRGLPVVVLSGVSAEESDAHLSRFPGLRVLRKPAGYQDVAAHVLEALEQAAMGQVAGIPLPAVLQLVEAERRSCMMVVRAGRRSGRLHFLSGALVNAFSEDAEGDAAARDILGWGDAAIEFQPLPRDARRLIDTKLQQMLIEVAVARDGEVRPPDQTPGAHEEAVMHDRPMPVDPHSHTEPQGDAPAVDDVAAAAAAAADGRDDGSGDSHADGGGAPDAVGASADRPPDELAAALVGAMERLSLRVEAADNALAAIGDEVEQFRQAQRDYERSMEQRERRRLELEAFREEVARLARLILDKVDVLFDDDAAALDRSSKAGERTPA